MTYKKSFNTQPLEGGWVAGLFRVLMSYSFNTQPPEGGWYRLDGTVTLCHAVSTHSRPKAAGECLRSACMDGRGFNTQPPEGGWTEPLRMLLKRPSFNTQPPEGGWLSSTTTGQGHSMFQHTAARRRLATWRFDISAGQRFQHTAARRRLADNSFSISMSFCFNTQPPEGGWPNSL